MSTVQQSSSSENGINWKLTHIILRIKDPNEMLEFYRNNFGMEEINIFKSSFQNNVYVLGYTTNYDEDLNKSSSMLPSPTLLEFHQDNLSITTPSLVNSGPSKVYWKIGLALYDVDYARKILITKQIHVTEASQFEDIGYVCHLKDPDGFSIELLQHDFENTFKENIDKNIVRPPTNRFPLGYPGCIGQVTLQSDDIDKTQKFYQDLLGMKLLSIQEVPKYGFTLYFYAWTNENPPVSDLKNVTVNREWLWKRPYTTIEIRHFHNPRQIPLYSDLQQNEIGFKGIRIMCDDLVMFIAKLETYNILFKESNGAYGKEIMIRDPNNVPFFVSQYASNR